MLVVALTPPLVGDATPELFDGVTIGGPDAAGGRERTDEVAVVVEVGRTGVDTAEVTIGGPEAAGGRDMTDEVAELIEVDATEADTAAAVELAGELVEPPGAPERLRGSPTLAQVCSTTL
ncbi:MAG: hypothetical protein M1827_002513 [Pycnora praestabilis]|nr:MAG: hypothetical protein M1827_002513 [Pycnora praestabilis]